MNRENRPSREQVHELIERLRGTDWRKLERRLWEAMEADRTGSVYADGYPRTASGGGGSGPGAVPVDPDDPSQGSVTLTPTEAAAEARLAESYARDKLRNHLEHAFSFLQEGAACAGALSSRLDLIDQLRRPGVVDVKWCESCKRVGVQRDIERYSDCGGRLNRAMHLCVMCYDFVARKAGRLPSLDELRHHEETGRWQVRQSA